MSQVILTIASPREPFQKDRFTLLYIPEVGALVAKDRDVTIASASAYGTNGRGHAAALRDVGHALIDAVADAVGCTVIAQSADRGEKWQAQCLEHGPVGEWRTSRVAATSDATAHSEGTSIDA